METKADDKLAPYAQAYDEDRSSQVVVIEGDQGTGKTNLLNYYEKEFIDVYPESDGYYIIRYYADPEPDFDKILGRILQELGHPFIERITEALRRRATEEQTRIIEMAKLGDMRTVLRTLLGKVALSSREEFQMAAEAAIEWLLGFRLFKRHREALGHIHFRLDTVESKTQALRDLVFIGADLDVLEGLILLLDELEKTDIATSKLSVLRFLSAIRALVDALPKYLFLMAAMTPEARRRYFEMLPAFAGRLQNRIELPYLGDKLAALDLYRFYLDEAKLRAKKAKGGNAPREAGDVISEAEAEQVFVERLDAAKEKGDAGVRQRDYLNELHRIAEERFAQIQL